MAELSAEAAYDAWAATYDSDANRTRDLDAAVLRRHGPDPAGLDVVEYGCGSGKNTQWLAATARSVLAMDVSEGMLARAREREPRARFIRADASQPWPCAAQGADLVVGNLVLEHIDALGPVFAEAARALRPGGRLYICELHPYRQMEGGRARFCGADGQTHYPVAYPRDVSDYLNAAAEAGFSLERAGEWRDAEGGPPRLFSAQFRR